jgi:hypothetical protein
MNTVTVVSYLQSSCFLIGVLTCHQVRFIYSIMFVIYYVRINCCETYMLFSHCCTETLIYSQSQSCARAHNIFTVFYKTTYLQFIKIYPLILDVKFMVSNAKAAVMTVFHAITDSRILTLPVVLDVQICLLV